ncbi:hypothetical protein MMC16_001795 [Acarospora aff. strigata]|nr:hypothetical protein [Acarospora aff. strigata]
MDPAVLAVTPAGPHPPGVTPDLVNGANMGRHSFVVANVVTCLVLTTVVVALRMFARVVVIKTVDWSDYLAVLGYVFSITYFSTTLALDDIRLGRHQWDMSLLDYLNTMEFENISSMIYCVGICFSKLSILFLFKKVFLPVHEGRVYWVNRILIYTNVMFYFGGLFGLIFACIPRAKISKPWLPGRCANVYLSFMLSGIWNVSSDFFILAFPLWAVWHLNIPLKRKFGVALVFAVGTFTLVCSIMRLHATSKLNHNPDTLYIIYKVALWT